MESKQEDRITNIKNFIFSSRDKIKDKFQNIFKTNKQQVNFKEDIKNDIQNNNRDNQEKKPIFSIEEDDFEKIYNYNIPDEDDDEIYEDEEESEVSNKDNNLISANNTNKINPSESTNNNSISQTKIESINKKSNELNVKDVYEEEYIDPNYICHRLYLKDSTIDLENLPYIQFYKLKEKNKVFSIIGFGKNQKVEEKCLALFDEHFLYIMKDKEDINHCINNRQNFIRKCHKYYCLKSITNISVKKIDSERTSVIIVFSLGTDLENLEYKTKTFNFYKENASRFLQIMDFYLKNLHIEMKVNEVE